MRLGHGDGLRGAVDLRRRAVHEASDALLVCGETDAERTPGVHMVTPLGHAQRVPLVQPLELDPLFLQQLATVTVEQRQTVHHNPALNRQSCHR